MDSYMNEYKVKEIQDNVSGITVGKDHVQLCNRMAHCRWAAWATRHKVSQPQFLWVLQDLFRDSNSFPSFTSQIILQLIRKIPSFPMGQMFPHQC